ncbi:hypothetical protein JRO89_XS12G0027500 [Xanthoceras sorbifolium]|uniref:ABC transporter domain-containing protein n=1 Tax=Xanthoceras sorbifolium TaxID=99658 RepID=A0ABQ8HAQ0_9ROSI|nr:hypothetical protein JRO89_XS12G0027500 [Xanthoceras sorbifolium]
MIGVKSNVNWVLHAIFLLILVLNLFPIALCVDGDDYGRTGNPATLPLVTQLIYGRLSNLTKFLMDDLHIHMGFCIKNVKADWKGAFDFSRNLNFLTNCIKNTKEDVTQRLCTSAEINFYLRGLAKRGSTQTIYLRLNKNCNLTSWSSGCEPGWGCSADEKVELKNSKNMPSRTRNCQPCCEGFFCPRGLPCMIRSFFSAFSVFICYDKWAILFICTSIDTVTKFLLVDAITLVAPQIRGQMLRLVTTFSVCQDHTAQLQQVKSLAVVDITAGGVQFLKNELVYHFAACFKLASCNAKTEKQNIHAYGIILIVGLTALMIIIYNWSDQVLITRERRQARRREAAARQARETAQARERWKSAKDVAKKRGVGLQQQLSRTFSRKKSIRQPEQLKPFGQSKPDVDNPSPSDALSSSEQSSAALKDNKKESSSLTKMTHAIEDDPNSHEAFHLEIGDKNIKKHAPKGKQLHSHSQIFKYAYGQLEKEKAMQENDNFTFSGIISMATDGDIKTRPAIEVTFKDLTLTLKGKNKHLLRCVNGKFMPGRVSAVMGPSGAGKTTFLNALAGKPTGCTKTGFILVNGKNESIHSYKKIIGYVPQDDIVHGNLTVEENLRFNARCRLSADMPKADKVLVIERVIESLGLQAVRDSLVGTVEKRGISGGQRKRVNVGIEMVMEPSLLILDEPTTGLDSASSQLLLRALKREAHEGVNICMVVHQPSYTLFKMFDDFVLLAKGGMIVYHGPVKKVEQYFAGIGITVPDRVNPPDHFIDVLEGIVKPNGGVTYQQLPVRWMIHNGYPVPADLLQYIGGDATPLAGHVADHAAESPGQSFAGDLWEDVKCNVELKRDHIQHNFLKSNDLSNRQTPGITRQYRYFLGRVGKQRLREARIQAVDFLILLVAGACLGTLAKVSDETFGSLGYTYTVIAVSLLCKISALRSFSLDKLHYRRESASGISSLAYFLAKNTVDDFNTIIKPLVYLSMFFFFNNPRSSFEDNYIVTVCLVYCVTGIAYVLAIFLEPAPAQLWSVILPVILTLLATQDKDSAIMRHLGNFCYTRWALEAFVIANAERYSGVWLITRCESLLDNGYDLDDWAQCLLCLLLLGMFSRMVAFFCMVTFKKK